MKNDIILLGAGASAPDYGTEAPGVPIAREMTNSMLDGLAGESAKIQHAVRLAVSTLMFGFGVRGEDPRLGVNIEDVFNLLTTLETRDSLEAAPLIGSWNPVVERLDRILTKPRQRHPSSFPMASGMSNSFDIDRVINAVKSMAGGKGGDFELRSALSSLIDKTSKKVTGLHSKKPIDSREIDFPQEVSGRGLIYKSARDYMIARLKTLVWLDDDLFVSRFDPMIRSSIKDQIIIATLNYDNGIELAAKKLGIPVDTGLGQWLTERNLGSRKSNSVSLLKLHGSIDWTMEPVPEKRGEILPHDTIRFVTPEELEKSLYPPALIFGGKNKLTVRGPFLDLLLDFRSSLFKSNRLIVIGYSFGDDHVNEYITQWFTEDESRKIVLVCGPNFSPASGGLGKKLLNIGEPRVTNTNQYAREGIASLFNESC